MARNGTDTRNRILDAAEDRFLSHGYGGTTLDAIVEQTGLTKGAFFHHFASKQDLALALIERYDRLDRELFASYLERAERLSRDPLQQVLVLAGLYEEAMEGLTEPYPGCLFASYCYQSGLLDARANEIVRANMLHWREVVGERFRAAIERHPPRLAVDPAELADGMLTVVEGAFILSKSLNEPKLVARQVRQYRNYIELLFGLV